MTRIGHDPEEVAKKFENLPSRALSLQNAGVRPRHGTELVTAHARNAVKIGEVAVQHREVRVDELRARGSRAHPRRACPCARARLLRPTAVRRRRSDRARRAQPSRRADETLLFRAAHRRRAREACGDEPDAFRPHLQGDFRHEAPACEAEEEEEFFHARCLCKWRTESRQCHARAAGLITSSPSSSRAARRPSSCRRWGRGFSTSRGRRRPRRRCV
ncbi:MAG: hypothetical protein RL077_253 [Verrucomicrobiota bacterium]